MREFMIVTIRDRMALPLPEDPSDETPLGPGGIELESLAFIELMLNVEQEFSITIEEEEFEQLASMGFRELVDCLEQRAQLSA